MKFIKAVTAFFIIVLFISGCSETKKENINSSKKPNIILILADDLGYGELSCYGQTKFQTPNIDSLAKTGIRFTQYYSGSPVCAPSRCIMLTGKHSGHAFIRGNDEWAERGDVWNYTKACSDPGLEGQKPIPADTRTLGKQLKKTGYITGIFGKWGLGAPESEGIPNKQGFDYFFGYNCQRQAHNLYPPHLWENEKKVLLSNELVDPGTKLDSLADPYNEASYKLFSQKDYAPGLIHQKALDFINNNIDTSFFIYYASPLPHLPLQAPAEFVDRFKSVYSDKEPYTGDKGYFPNRFPKATYAAMITYLDNQVGELVSALKKSGIYENTIIIFTSDNGPTYTGGVDFEFFDSSNPFSNGYGRTKGFLYEGGIRVPMIVSWPKFINEEKVSNHVSASYDIFSTICDIIDIDPPDDIDGLSFKPVLLNQQQSKHDFLYWEFPSYNGQQAVRWNSWKGIRKNIFDGNNHIELYDLETDIKENDDVASQHPEIVRIIDSIMSAEHTFSPEFKLEYRKN